MTPSTQTCLSQWAEDARLFASRPGEDNDTALTLIVADFEYRYDRDRHTGYKIAEGKAAEPKIRWCFHRIAAVSWMILRFVPGKTVPELEEPVVLTAETRSEKQMVEAFFDACRAQPDGLITSWGGEAKDFAALRATAMMHSLVVPAQLVDLHPHSRHRIDLCQTTSVAAPSVHLPEFAAALAIPNKPSPSEDIGPLVENEEWEKVSEQVLADVVTTTVIALLQLSSLGQVTIDRAMTLQALSERLQRSAPHSQFCTRTFAAWARARHAEAGLRGAIYRTPLATGSVSSKRMRTKVEGEPA